MATTPFVRPYGRAALLFLAIWASAVAGERSCEPLLAPSIVRLVCHVEVPPSPHCCQVLHDAVSEGGVACLCFISAAPSMLVSGYRAEDVMNWYMECINVTGTIETSVATCSSGHVLPSTATTGESRAATGVSSLSVTATAHTGESSDDEDEEYLPSSRHVPLVAHVAARWPWKAVIALAAVIAVSSLMALGMVMWFCVTCTGGCCGFLVRYGSFTFSARRANTALESRTPPQHHIGAPNTAAALPPPPQQHNMPDLLQLAEPDLLGI